MYQTLEDGLVTIISYGILVVECIGAVLILFYTGKALILQLQKKHSLSRKSMNTGITTGLNFLLGSEVLKTIIAPDWSDVGLTCAVLLMRAGINLLVHWENKLELQEQKKEQEE